MIRGELFLKVGRGLWRAPITAADRAACILNQLTFIYELQLARLHEPIDQIGALMKQLTQHTLKKS